MTDTLHKINFCSMGLILLLIIIIATGLRHNYYFKTLNTMSIIFNYFLYLSIALVMWKKCSKIISHLAKSWINLFCSLNWILYFKMPSDQLKVLSNNEIRLQWIRDSNYFRIYELTLNLPLNYSTKNKIGYEGICLFIRKAVHLLMLWINFHELFLYLTTSVLVLV